jgi:hypothetical protein
MAHRWIFVLVIPLRQGERIDLFQNGPQLLPQPGVLCTRLE